MKTHALALLLSSVAFHAFSQTETLPYKTVAAAFQHYYNASAYDSIFNLFDEPMQKALPIEKTNGFLTDVKKQAGNISKMQFIKMSNGTMAVYKTNFENALLSLNISLNSEGSINGFFIKPYADETQAAPARNTTPLSLPFRNEWTVIWGGDTKEQNYHVVSPAQKNAFDLVMTNAAGKSYKTTGETNEDYYAFGQEIVAPCEGKVVLVVNGVKDNAVGEMNKFNVGGNTVVIKTAGNEYLVFCHFKHQSIKVAEGQQVQAGQLLGLCGNTGNSSEPHLHFHIQNTEDLNTATGIKCYFSKLLVNGKPATDYSPVKGEKIKPQ